MPVKCQTGLLHRGHTWKRYRIPGTEDNEIGYDDPIIAQHFGNGTSKCWNGIWGGVQVCEKCGYAEIAKVHVDGGHYDATWVDNATLMKPFTLEEIIQLSKRHMDWRNHQWNAKKRRDEESRQGMLSRV
jgi:hypothetical protein